MNKEKSSLPVLFTCYNKKILKSMVTELKTHKAKFCQLHTKRDEKTKFPTNQ